MDNETNVTADQATGATDNQEQQEANEDQQTLEQQAETISKFEYEKLNTTLKKVSQNFDRLNTEKQKLAKELDERRQKDMKVDEYNQLKQNEYKSQLEEKEKAIKKMELDFKKTKIISEKELDPVFVEVVQGDDIDIFSVNINHVNDMIEKEVEKRVNKKLVTSNPVPEASGDKKSSKDEIYTLQEYNEVKNDRHKINANYDKFIRSVKVYQRR
jgi:hypothetical protein